MSRYLNDPRYRPALLALAGISAAYAIYFIRERYTGPQTQLRRRGAIRRQHAPRRQTNSSSPPTDSIALAEQALAALRHREEHNRPYGFLDIHIIEQEQGQDTDRRRETRWPLLPSTLPTFRQFRAQESSLTTTDLQSLRDHAERMFIGTFLANQYPSAHTIGPREARYLEEQLLERGIASSIVRDAIEEFHSDPSSGVQTVQQSQDSSRNPALVEGVADVQRTGESMQAMDGRDTTADEHSNFDWREGNGNGDAEREGQNTLNILFNIAADEARRDGYIHRGVECNGCGIMPIQGIRYRCTNCLDFDLCESCEAQELHTQTHVFYKIRVPAPSLGALGNSRHGLPVWYPGRPSAMPRSLPQDLSHRLLRESGFENSEFNGIWDQFRCLAGTQWIKDPNFLGMAIDRKTFDKCFVPPLSIRPPPPNLIYDRMFAFYDTNQDGLIGFEEFVKGLASLNDKSRDGKLRRIFKGYDCDGDWFVERKDFLRMFRAFYTLNKELHREMVAGMEEDPVEGGVRDIIHGRQPISSAFPSSIPPGHPSQAGVGKDLDRNGDLVISDSRGILDEDSQDIGNRHQLIADTATRYGAGSRGAPSFLGQAERDHRPVGEGQGETGTSGLDPRNHHDSSAENDALALDEAPLSHHLIWPPHTEVQTEDIVSALGSEVPLSEIMDPVDRCRVLFAQSQRVNAEFEANERRRAQAVQERWRRRRFYTDVEEGGTAPAGYTEADSSDDESGTGEDALESITFASISRPLSPRSRSSSKVRFEDSVTDTDYETRSNTSSRSIPVGERWGGYDINEIEKDAGKEILYQAVQQGFNELLDQLFKEKEDLAMEAHKTRKTRRLHAKEIQEFAKSLKSTPPTGDGWSGIAGDGAAFGREAWVGDLGKQDKIAQETHDSKIDELVREAGFVFDNTTTSTTEEETGALLHGTDQQPQPLSNQPSNTEQANISYLNHETQRVPSSSPQSDGNSNHSHDNQDPDPDQTLPQFRPNEPGTNAPLFPGAATTSSSATPDAGLENHFTPLLSTILNAVSAPPSSFSPPYSAAQTTLLKTYLNHEEVDQEAKCRGGFGRLDYEEFVKGMVGEDITAVGKERGGGEGGKGKQWGGGDGMGRLGFVGTWIEMARF